MKTRAKLAVLALALVVLAGAWLLAEYMAGRFTPEEAAEEPEVVDLSAGMPGDMTALSWSYGGQTVNLGYDGGAWYNADDSACPIDSQAVEPLVQAICSLSATVVSREVEDLDPYGLDAPSLTIMAATADHIDTYQLGSASPGGGYYLCVAGSSTVYVVGDALAEVFHCSVEQLLSVQVLPEDVAQITALSVQTDVESYYLYCDEQLGLSQYDGRYSWFRSQPEGDTPLVDGQALALCRQVLDMDLTSCVSWDGEALGDYGLLTPQGTVTLDYVDSQGQTCQLCLEFGDYQAGDVYVRLAGSPVVYLAEGTVLDGLMYPDWDAMTPLDACPVDWQEVVRAVVELDGHTYDIQRYQETTQVQTRPDQEAREVTELIYSASGWILDADLVQTWLQGLSALQGEGLAADVAGRESLFSVTLYRSDTELSPVSLALYTYDSTRCLCLVNETQQLFVARDSAMALYQKLSDILILE
jgi:hypothetical protein